jgi:hypothetical protein
MSNRRRNCSTVVSRNGTVSMTPAAVTSASSPPNASRTCANAATCRRLVRDVDLDGDAPVACCGPGALVVAVEAGHAPAVGAELSRRCRSNAAGGTGHRHSSP